MSTPVSYDNAEANPVIVEGARAKTRVARGFFLRDAYMSAVCMCACVCLSVLCLCMCRKGVERA